MAGEPAPPSLVVNVGVDRGRDAVVPDTEGQRHGILSPGQVGPPCLRTQRVMARFLRLDQYLQIDAADHPFEHIGRDTVSRYRLERIPAE